MGELTLKCSEKVAEVVVFRLTEHHSKKETIVMEKRVKFT